MATTKLIPNVERRLSAWVSMQERLERGQRGEPRLTLTISRQFGCEAYPLSELLSARLEERTGEVWTTFDEALIERASRDTDLAVRLLEGTEEQFQLLDNLANLIPGWRTHSETYELLARYILKIAHEGNAIIVGRGGAVVTQRLANCRHFRLEAPYAHRVQSIQQRLGVDRAAAEALVVEHERGRERFIERFLRCSMADTRYYHAVYNTEKCSLESIAGSIIELLAPLTQHPAAR